MKNILTFFLILSIAVLCSACINNLAVQQLNNKAKEYSEEGNLQTAVARLESSIDLDGNIFETRYNLAVLYIDLKDCEKALKQINEAEKLVKNEPSVFYVQGMANDCLADGIYKDKDGEVIKYSGRDEILENATKYIKYLNDANIAYEKYFKLAPASDRNQTITFKMMSNRQQIEEYERRYGISL